MSVVDRVFMEDNNEKECAASLVEYALVVSLISVVTIVAIAAFSRSIQISSYTSACMIDGRILYLSSGGGGASAEELCQQAAELCVEQDNQLSCQIISP